MKLAEALLERADLQKRIAQLGSRLYNNAKVQEGDAPAEDPVELLAELDRSSMQLEELMTRINLTNAATRQDGHTITELLAQRDCRMQKLKILRDFLDSASATVQRGLRTEIRIISTVKVAELQKQVDRLSKELRQLDMLIQSLNWTTELL